MRRRHAIFSPRAHIGRHVRITDSRRSEGLDDTEIDKRCMDRAERAESVLIAPEMNAWPFRTREHERSAGQKWERTEGAR